MSPINKQSHLADTGSFNIYEINHNPAHPIISDAITMVLTIDHLKINSAIAVDYGSRSVRGYWKFTQTLLWT